MKIIGKNLSTLKNYIGKCKDKNGKVIVRSGFGGVEFKDKIIVACYNANLKSGLITELPTDFVKKVSQKNRESMYDSKKKMTLNDLMKLITKYTKEEEELYV